MRCAVQRSLQQQQLHQVPTQTFIYIFIFIKSYCSFRFIAHCSLSTATCVSVWLLLLLLLLSSVIWRGDTKWCRIHFINILSLIDVWFPIALSAITCSRRLAQPNRFTPFPILLPKWHEHLFKWQEHLRTAWPSKHTLMLRFFLYISFLSFFSFVKNRIKSCVKITRFDRHKNAIFSHRSW